MDKRKRMEAEAAPRPEKKQDRGDGGGAEGRPTTSSVSSVGEHQQAAAASRPELSRRHVHGEAEEGSAAAASLEGQQFRPWVGQQFSSGRQLVLPRNRDDLSFLTPPATAPDGPASTAALSSTMASAHDAPGPSSSAAVDSLRRNRADISFLTPPATAPGGQASTAALSSMVASAHDVPGSSSSAAADAPSTGASSPARGSVEVLGEDRVAAAASASPDHAAAPAAAALAPPAGVNLPYKKQRAALREGVHHYLAPEPLMVDDDSTFRQMAVAIQNIRGTAMNLANLSGADALRLVLPDGTNFGRGKLGLYRAGLEFLRANEQQQQQQQQQ